MCKKSQFVGLLIVDDKGNRYVVDGPYIPDGVDFKQLYLKANELEFPFMLGEFNDVWDELEASCIVDDDAYDYWLDHFDEWIEQGED